MKDLILRDTMKDILINESNMSSKDVKLVIFDLDGTLLDTLEDLAAATNYALVQEGKPTHEVEKYRGFIGNGIKVLFQKALGPENATEENVLKVQGHFKKFYSENGQSKTKPYDGIMELLCDLQRKGVRLAIASNKYQEGVDRLVDTYFKGVDFIAALGQRDGVAKKPDPTIIYEVLEIANLDKEECLYVGDMDIDMNTAKAAGVKAVGVSWGFLDRSALEAFLPYAIIDKPEELMTLLD